MRVCLCAHECVNVWGEVVQIIIRIIQYGNKNNNTVMPVTKIKIKIIHLDLGTWIVPCQIPTGHRPAYRQTSDGVWETVTNSTTN